MFLPDFGASTGKVEKCVTCCGDRRWCVEVVSQRRKGESEMLYVLRIVRFGRRPIQVVDQAGQLLSGVLVIELVVERAPVGDLK